MTNKKPEYCWLVILSKGILVPFRFVGYKENYIFFQNRGKDKQITGKKKSPMCQSQKIHSLKHQKFMKNQFPLFVPCQRSNLHFSSSLKG